MEHRQPFPGVSPRNIGVFVVICALHTVVIHWIGTRGGRNPDSLWSAIEVSFVTAEKPEQPPPPAPVPILLSDAFAMRELMEIPAPTADLSAAAEEARRAAIEVPPPPEVLPEADLAPIAGRGYGPLTKPRVISRPKHLFDRYPRASIRHQEAGTPVVRICTSETGTVDSVDLAQGSGYSRLDAAAVDLSWDYVFAPAMREGKPVPVCLTYEIKFRLAASSPRRRT